MPEVSVVMSTYNREHFLREAVACVLRQIDVDLELVVVDNGSSDGTASYLAALKDPRVRVVRNPSSLGPTGGRNSGLAAATGTFVGFLDDDDLWAPDKLKRQLAAMRETGATWSYTGCVYIDAERRVIGGRPAPAPDDVAAELPRKYVIPGGISSMLWRRGTLDADGLLDPRFVWSTDWDLSLRLSRTGAPASVHAPLVAYRQHSANVSKSAEKQTFELAIIAEKFADLVDEPRTDLASAYQFMGSEALRSGHRSAALRLYIMGMLRGDVRSLLRVLAVLAPVALHPWLRRLLLSDRAWLEQGRGWLRGFNEDVAMRRTVVIAQARIPQYRVPFLNGLRAELTRRGIDLEVLHATSSTASTRGDDRDLPWAREVPMRTLHLGGRRLHWLSIVRRTRNADLVVVEQATRQLVNIRLLLGRAVAGRAKVAFWGHGHNHGQVVSRSAEFFKRLQSRRADWFFAYTEGAARSVAAMGIPASRITVVWNATDTSQLIARRQELGAGDAKATLARLGLHGGHVAMFLGAHVPSKRLDLVMAGFEAAREELPELEVILVGDGPERPAAEQWCRERPWAAHAGPLFGSALADVAHVVDVVVSPVLAGLVVVDAFGLGKPMVISGDRAQMPEADYVQDGVNGRVIRDGGDIELWGRELAALLRDRPLVDALSEGAARSASQITVERMVQNFADGIQAALGR